MRGIVALIGLAGAAGLSGCGPGVIVPQSDEGRFLAAIEAQGCSFDANDPPIVSFSNSYSLNPGVERTPDIDRYWAKVKTRKLIEAGYLRRVRSDDGSERIVSNFGACGSRAS